ncbi:MAG: hypothetical protein K2G25_09570 [Oscillospiraceae bacterium]|nr:hypothetical protein [Oscillospiraceae bacterium]
MRLFRKFDIPSRNQDSGSGVSVPVKRKSVYYWINVLLFVFGGGFALYLPMMTNAITFPLVPIIIILNLVLGYIYQRVRQADRGWKPFRILQILTILVTAIFFMIPLSLFWFQDSQIMYPYKKYIYAKGVYGDPEHCDWMLPEKLPEVCEDYRIITQGSFVAQDYHAGIYLTFRTDRATIQAYQGRIESLNKGEKFENVPDPDEDGNTDSEFENHFPDYECRILDVEQDLRHSIVYILHSSYYYSQGCLLDYETGTVIFWM